MNKEIKNAFYAQSGGVTAVINTTACGVIQTAREHANEIGTVYAGYNGILGALREELIDTNLLSNAQVAALYHTPGGAFGSCRYQFKPWQESQAEYERLFAVFAAYHIGYLFYNGGGDSQDTTSKISEAAKQYNYPLTCIGIPKTVDNDLPITDNCPGFGSVAKYVATSVLETSLDVASMSESSTKVFILEVMGRHAGWIAAASGLAQRKAGDSPHLILFPEIPLDKEKILTTIQQIVQKNGFCVIVASEGVKTMDGKFISDSGQKDAFGHAQLGGVAPVLSHWVKQELKLKNHWAVSDYLQRAARHIASQTDVEQAYAIGKSAVLFALAGKNNVMPILVRENQHPYRWSIVDAPLFSVANVEKKVPRDFITEDGFGITTLCREYLMPLIQGEAYPPYREGIPQYLDLRSELPTLLAKQKLE